MNEFDEQQAYMTDSEKDALGEIGNICMGTAATTLNTLLSRRVSITTPQVIIPGTVEKYNGVGEVHVAAMVDYTTGIQGYNIFLLKKRDAFLITDLLMGGDGHTLPEEEIEALYLSAISEVMNQMVGSSATAMSNILNAMVNISPPSISEIELSDDNLRALIPEPGPTVYISFTMEIEDLLTSEIMQVMPFEFAKELASNLISGDDMAELHETPPQQAAEAPQAPVEQPQAAVQEPQAAPMQQQPAPAQEQYAQPQQAYAPPPQQAAPYQQPPAYQQQYAQQQEVNRVGVKAVQYQSFDEEPIGYTTQYSPHPDNLDLIMDVPLQVTVELGKSKKNIKEVLSMSMGSVIVLDRMAGEMVDVMVNGKMFARGEVVVIDDNYGVRITDIVAKPNFEVE
ncbi:flagellar motor switch phosphatase FliY [Eubacteriales bacterium OttesenSCG-928-N14]|nr:flagellar motor switch phosphatase FliY [Eubacteriales bacterium OttesenSCG-928-N14]